MCNRINDLCVKFLPWFFFAYGASIKRNPLKKNVSLFRNISETERKEGQVEPSSNQCDNHQGTNSLTSFAHWNVEHKKLNHTVRAIQAD